MGSHELNGALWGWGIPYKAVRLAAPPVTSHSPFFLFSAIRFLPPFLAEIPPIPKKVTQHSFA
jgi:hypothetical protein